MRHFTAYPPVLAGALLSSAFAGCVPGASSSPPDAELSDPGRSAVVGHGADVFVERRETPDPNGSPFDLEEPAEIPEYATPEDEDPVIEPIEEVLAVDDVLPELEELSAMGVGAWPPPTADELRVMSDAGVDHVRVFVAFYASEDYAAPSEGYVAALDGLFADSARVGVTLLPVLIAPDQVPDVDEGSLTAWGDYAFWLGARYAEDGDFWDERDDLEPLPPHAWEVWSEPNHPDFWPGAAVSAAHYRTLLLFARVGLRDADPTAKVLVGGLAPVRVGAAESPEAFLRALLETADARELFDAVALHPYAPDADATVSSIGSLRDVLVEHDLADVGVWVTSTGWALRGGDSALDAASEDDRTARTAALLDAVEARRAEWNLGPVFWAAHRDLGLEETGGVDGWSAHAGLFETRDGQLVAGPLAEAALSARATASAPAARPAPGRTGAVLTNNPSREARRAAGTNRRRRARRRNFRRTVIGRMYHIGICTRTNAEGVTTMKNDCSPWLLSGADTWKLDEHPEWSAEDRRVSYVCSAIRRLEPQYVSGLVRYSYEHVLQGDRSVQDQMAEEARVFRRVRRCVRRPGQGERRRRRVRFDVVLNSLHYSHTSHGVTSGSMGAERHRQVLRALDADYRPDVWFYDFYTDPYDGHRLCYGAGNDRCDDRFYPDGMTAGIAWAHNNDQWIGGNTFFGRDIPRGTDLVSLTSAGARSNIEADRDRSREGNPDLPILMHLRNDPQLEGTEGVEFVGAGDNAVKDILRDHYRWQSSIGYGYMTPVFFPFRYVRNAQDRIVGAEAFDARERSMLNFMRWNTDHRRSRP